MDDNNKEVAMGFIWVIILCATLLAIIKCHGRNTDEAMYNKCIELYPPAECQ